MTLPEIAIKRPVTILMVLVSIVVLGLVALTRLPLAFMPNLAALSQSNVFQKPPLPKTFGVIRILFFLS